MLFSKKAKVILDTNVLLLPHKGFDIFTEIDRLMDIPYQLIVVDKTFAELKKIIDGGTGASGDDKFAAKLGYVMAKQMKVKAVNLKMHALSVDDQIVALCKENVFVFTLDKELQKRIKETNAKVISKKGKGLHFLN